MKKLMFITAILLLTGCPASEQYDVKCTDAQSVEIYKNTKDSLYFSDVPESWDKCEVSRHKR